ncbi:ABC transporter substrate-binding protein [Paraburkholderia sediminicola]|uniref:ABC transporter substrate-binding protein n=1 Tax=Paraburkholderia sediminicola TaxID=458836 RepID=UPI0038B9351E
MKLLSKYVVAVIACSTVFSPIARANGLDDIKSRGTLICGVMSNVEPFGFQDPSTRQLQGYDVDFCNAIAKSLHVKPELKAVSLEARIPELTQGRVDILAAILGWNPSRAEQIDYSDTYFVSQQRVAVIASSSYKQPTDLAGKRVSVIKGASTPAFLKRAVPTAETVSYDDTPSAVMALVQHKVEGAGMSETILRRFVAKLGPSGDLKVISPSLGEEPWGLGIRKGEPELQKAVNAALQEMEKSGEAQRIFDKWLGPKSVYDMKREFHVEPIKG